MGHLSLCTLKCLYIVCAGATSLSWRRKTWNSIRLEHATPLIWTHTFTGAILHSSMMLTWTINRLRMISCKRRVYFADHISFFKRQYVWQVDWIMKQLSLFAVVWRNSANAIRKSSCVDIYNYNNLEHCKCLVAKLLANLFPCSFPCHWAI